MGAGTVNANQDMSLSHRLHLNSVPAVIGVINGKLHYFSKPFSISNMRDFTRSFLPSGLVTEVRIYIICCILRVLYVKYSVPSRPNTLSMAPIQFLRFFYYPPSANAEQLCTCYLPHSTQRCHHHITPILGALHWLPIRSLACPSSVAERSRGRLCNQKIAGSNPASGHLATPIRKAI